jgi:hypothetical protein
MVDPIVASDIQLFAIGAMTKSACVWPKVSEDMSPFPLLVNIDENS